MPDFITEGFAHVAHELGRDVVGEAVEDEHDLGKGSGIVVQTATRGVMWYSKQGNQPAFIPFTTPPPQNPELRTQNPSSSSTSSTPIPLSLPVEPRNQLDLRPVSAIKLIVVHWDGSGTPFSDAYDPAAVYAREARAHIAKDWGSGSFGYSLMYHERISRDGRAWLTRPAEHIVWACCAANRISYNLCVDAGPDWDATPSQLAALAARVERLRTDFGLSRTAVWGHGELAQYGNQTQCPGDYLTSWCWRYRRGEA